MNWFTKKSLRALPIKRVRTFFKTVKNLGVLFLLAVSAPVFADCVHGAKDKNEFIVLDSRTVILQGGLGADIVIKLYSVIGRYSSITVLKDSFCSYEGAVLKIDGEVVDVGTVTKLQ